MTDELLADFLTTIYGDAEGRVSVWWRSSPGSKSPYNQKQWFTWPAQQDEMEDFIESISDKDVCVTTATYTEDRRTPEYTDKTQVIWMDSDVCEGEHYLVAPTWTVTTSSGRWQHFWALTEPVTALEASELSHRMAVAHEKQGADPSSWPANKIMRVPGTMNTSHGFPTRVKGVTSGEIYTYDEVLAPYKHIELPNRALVREIPELSVDELPPYGNITAKLSPELLDLALAEPKPDQDRSRLRYKLLLELFRAGLDFPEVLSVAWHAPACRKWSEEDPRGLAGLSMEAVKAAAEAGTPSAEPHDPFPVNVDEDVELAIDKPVSILTDDERATVARSPSFIDRYNAYARKRLPHDNDAYDRLNAWMLLSLAYMDSGFIPNPAGKVCLNLFGILIGETTTGKTTSFKLMKGVLREYFHSDPEFNIGGNASESALIKTLHDRDGKVSFFNSDEAQGVLKTWVTQDWTSGMREKIAELYEGTVPPILRSGRGESVTKSSTALLNVYLAGTQRGVMEHMTPELFHSGFIPRFLFAIGKPRNTDYDSYALLQGDGKDILDGFDPAARQIAAELRANRNAIREFHQGEAPILVSEEAARRLQDAAYGLDREFRKSPIWDMIQPSIIRWRDSVHKAACLLAMDNRRTTVSLEDMLHALNAGEEWFTNLLRVISRLSAGAFERACSDIYGFVNSRGGKVTSTVLYRRFPGFRGFEMDDYLKALERQGRVIGMTENKRTVYVTDAYRERNAD